MCHRALGRIATIDDVDITLPPPKQKKTKQERKITKISLITIANSLNLFLLPFVVILFAFNGQSEISADLPGKPVRLFVKQESKS